MILLVLSVIVLIYYFSNTVKPAIYDIADSTVNDNINLIISETVLKVISENNIQYSDIVNISDKDGIVILSGNTVLMNKIKNSATQMIINKLNENNTFDVSIPLVQLFRNSLIRSGKFHIKVTVVQLTTVKFRFYSKFESVGINQTNSIITAEITTEYKIITPVSVIDSSVKTDVPIAHNTIVGNVPDSYVNVTSTPDQLKDDVLQLYN